MVRIGLVVDGAEYQAGLVTSTAFSAAVTPGAVAPTKASARVVHGQVVLVVYSGVGFLDDELDD